MDELFLTGPAPEYIPQIEAFKAEFADCPDWLHGAQGLRDAPSAEEWLRYLALCGNDAAVPEGVHRYSQFLYVRASDRKIVGMIGVRHRPVGPLETWGGHIGYGVAPPYRGKGYGKALLGLLLEKAREMGIGETLVTVRADNAASRAVALANGGRITEETDERVWIWIPARK